MRISDWSSDVCSSDLREQADAPTHGARRRRPPRGGAAAVPWQDLHAARQAEPAAGECRSAGQGPQGGALRHLLRELQQPKDRRGRPGGAGQERRRSEEHTSELQSLMRISYAVFCLKKTKKKNDRITLHQENVCTPYTT